MTTRINSKVFLSKKMREAIKDGASISFSLHSITNGSAICHITATGNIDKKELEKIVGEETNLTFRVLSVEEMREDVGGEDAIVKILNPQAKARVVIKDPEPNLEEVETFEEPQDDNMEQEESGLPDWFGVQSKNKDAEETEYDTSMLGTPLETFFTQDFEPYKGRKTTTSKDIVDKIAATSPPNIDDIPYSFKDEDEIEDEVKDSNENLEALKNPEFKRFVTDLNSFYDALHRNKNKQSSIDLSKYEGNPRQYAVMEEQKRLEESIDVPAYIVNEKYASLMVNDLDLTLGLNSPIDLAKFPVKKLLSSNELKNIIKQNYVRFVSPAEANKILMKKMEQEENEFTQNEIIDRDADEEDDSAPKGKQISKVRSVTSLRDRDASEILDLIGDSGKGERADIIDLEGDLDGPTEEEGLVNLVGKPMPTMPKGANRSTTRVTSHGSVKRPDPNPSRQATNVNKSPVAQIKKLSPVFRK